MPILTTARLSLRELTEDDADFMLRLLNEPAYWRYIGDRGVRTTADARAYLARGPLASYRRHGFGLWAVTLPAAGPPLGICGLIKREILPDVDLGYAFLTEAWGRGYAYEAAAAVLEYGRRRLGLRRVVAVVDPANDRSIAVLRKLGLRFERPITWPEDDTPLQLFATPAEDPPAPAGL